MSVCQCLFSNNREPRTIAENHEDSSIPPELSHGALRLFAANELRSAAIRRGAWGEGDEIRDDGGGFDGVGPQVALDDLGLRRLPPKIGRDCQWDLAKTDRWH